MKYSLELNCPDRKFLNYWDSINGNDVVCEIVDGKLLLREYVITQLGESEVHTLNDKEITLSEFIELVEKSATFPTLNAE